MNRFRLQTAMTLLLTMASSSGALAKSCNSDTRSSDGCGRSINTCVSALSFNGTLAELAAKSRTDPSDSLEEIQEEFHSTFAGDTANVHAAWCESTIGYSISWPLDADDPEKEHAEKVVFYKGEKCASAKACLDCGGDFSLEWFGYDCTNVEGGVEKECCQDLTPDVAEPVVEGGATTAATPTCPNAGIKDFDDCLAAGGIGFDEESVFGINTCTRCTGRAKSDIGVVDYNICTNCSSANASKNWWMTALMMTAFGMMLCLSW